MTVYAELQATSNFSFLRGASHPGELVEAAAAAGLAAIALTDRNSLAGVVRAHQAARTAADFEGGHVGRPRLSMQNFGHHARGRP